VFFSNHSQTVKLSFRNCDLVGSSPAGALLNMHFIARRAMIAAAAAAIVTSPTAQPATAIQPSTVVASGMVQLQSGAAALGADAPGAALYVRQQAVSNWRHLDLRSHRLPRLPLACSPDGLPDRDSAHRR
jgi:hypothetical protein